MVAKGQGGWLLIPFCAGVFEKFMHHVYYKQLFTCHKFKKGKLQISLLVCKVSVKSWGFQQMKMKEKNPLVGS